MSGANKPTKQIGYMAFPGIGHVVYLTREEVLCLKKFPPAVLQLMVKTIVCELLDIQADRLVEKTRKQPMVLARHVCMYSLTIDFQFNLTVVGRVLRPDKPYDHTTVIHGRETIKSYLDPTDRSKFAQGVKQIYSQLNSKLKKYIDEDHRINGASGKR